MTARNRRSALTLLASLLLASGTNACAQASERSKQFIYVLRVAPRFHDPREWTERESSVVGQHFDRLTRATAQGQLILAGRTTEALSATFGVVIFEAATIEAARLFMESDPVVAAGLMIATLHPYAVVLQRAPRVE
ncbi:MAG: YciI family protein [Burkholderiaceae bacterium]